MIRQRGAILPSLSSSLLALQLLHRRFELGDAVFEGADARFLALRRREQDVGRRLDGAELPVRRGKRLIDRRVANRPSQMEGIIARQRGDQVGDVVSGVVRGFKCDGRRLVAKAHFGLQVDLHPSEIALGGMNFIGAGFRRGICRSDENFGSVELPGVSRFVAPAKSDLPVANRALLVRGNGQGKGQDEQKKYGGRDLQNAG